LINFVNLIKNNLLEQNTVIDIRACVFEIKQNCIAISVRSLIFPTFTITSCYLLTMGVFTSGRQQLWPMANISDYVSILCLFSKIPQVHVYCALSILHRRKLPENGIDWSC